MAEYRFPKLVAWVRSLLPLLTEHRKCDVVVAYLLWEQKAEGSIPFTSLLPRRLNYQASVVSGYIVKVGVNSNPPPEKVYYYRSQ
jgi:hypothetical protein